MRGPRVRADHDSPGIGRSSRARLPENMTANSTNLGSATDHAPAYPHRYGPAHPRTWRIGHQEDRLRGRRRGGLDRNRSDGGRRSSRGGQGAFHSRGQDRARRGVEGRLSEPNATLPREVGGGRVALEASTRKASRSFLHRPRWRRARVACWEHGPASGAHAGVRVTAAPEVSAVPEIEDELATLALETGDDDELADHGTRVRGGLFQA